MEKLTSGCKGLEYPAEQAISSKIDQNFYSKAKRDVLHGLTIYQLICIAKSLLISDMESTFPGKSIRRILVEKHK